MNTLPALLTAVASSAHLSCVTAECDATPLELLLIETPATRPDLTVGSSVTLLFKETEVLLTPTLPQGITANILPVTVIRSDAGAVLTHVDLAFGSHRLAALVPSRPFATLNAAPGIPLYALISPSQISLARS